MEAIPFIRAFSFMAFTSANLVDLETAIVDSFTATGKNSIVEYSMDGVNVKRMSVIVAMKLYDWMANQVNGTSKVSYALAKFSQPG